MTPSIAKQFERIKAMIVCRLQTAGPEGLSANEFAPMIQTEFHDRSRDACRNVLIRMANDGKIFRKAVGMDKGGVQSHYFLTVEWCDAYAKNLLPSHRLGEPETPLATTIPKYGMVERDPLPYEFGAGIIIPAHVRVKVCDPYKSDYRMAVDPSSIQRNIDSSQCRDWAKA
jgi:hypothetical protein